MDQTRRSLLGSIGAVASVGLAGCASDDDDESSGGGGEPVVEDGESGGSGGGSGGGQAQPEELIDDTRTIPEGDYYRWCYNFSQPVEIEIQATVRDGPEAEILFMSKDEFSHFEDGDRARYYPQLSDIETTGYTATEQMEAGEYCLVVDNSDLGETRPPANFDEDYVEAEVEMAATPL